MLRIERAWRREDETPRSIHVPSPDPAEEALKAAALEAKYEPELWRVARSMMSEPYPRGFGRQGTRRRATDGRWRAPTPSAQRAERRDAYLFMLGKGPRVILQSAEWDRVTLEFAKELSRQCREWWLKEMLGTWPRDKRARQELRVKIPALIRPHEAGLTLSHHVLELMYGMTREPRFRWRVSKMWVALADKNLTYDIVTQASQGVEDSFVKMRQPPWIRSPETWRWRWSRWDRWMERERREKHMKALDQNLWVTCPLCDLKLLVPAGGVEVECPTCGGLVQTPRESP
ncbi:MAG: hypothetical protein JSU68_13875 [Phycisphaerales bacterium]|nr:MAG: hypothetical protein JSU68_13875 [Phycisphaerales bacterium]